MINRKELRSITFVILGLTFSTLTGFFRQSVIAFTLGAGRKSDIFFIAYAIPEFIYIALPIILWPIFIPLFSKVRTEKGERAAWIWATQLSGWVILILVIFTLLCIIFAPILLGWLSPGFDASEQKQTIDIFYPMIPSILLMGLSFLLSSFLQIYRRFVRPALTTAVYNLVFVACLLWLPFDNPIDRTGWSVTLAAGFAALFQLPIILRLWYKVKNQSKILTLSHYKMSEAFQLLWWMTIGYSVHHLILFIDRAMATGLGTGAVATLNFGYHLALVVGQVSGAAVSFVAFPIIVKSFVENNLKDTEKTLQQALWLVLGIALPLGVTLIVLRDPLVNFLLDHGAFSDQAVNAVSQVMTIYTLAVVMDSLCQPFWRLVYASRKGWLVFGVNSIQTFLRIIANLVLTKYFGYNGLVWSAVIGLSIQLILLKWLTRKKFNININLTAGKVMLWVLLSAITAGLIGAGMLMLIKSLHKDITSLFQIILGGSFILFLYGLLIRPLINKLNVLGVYDERKSK